MTCEHARSSLIGFHFGVLPADEREAIEGHLPACRACLVEFFELKRTIEAGEDAPRPRDAVRERLRRAVAGKLMPAPVPRRRWERPFAAAFAVSVMLAAMFATRAMTSGPGAPPHAVMVRDASG